MLGSCRVAVSLLSLSLLIAPQSNATDPARTVAAATAPAAADSADGKRYIAAVAQRVEAGEVVQRGLRRLETASQPLTLRLNERGLIRFLAGFTTRSYRGSAEDAARAFLNEYPELLGLASPTHQLALVKALEFQGVHFVRFNQELDGVSVAGAEVVVSISAKGEAFQLASHHLPDYRPEGNWVLSADEALAGAQQVKPVRPRELPKAEKVWWPKEPGTLIPAWRLHVPASEPFGDWEYVVDARNGEVLQVDNLMRGVADGLVFPTNPVKGGLTPQRVTLQNLVSAQNLDGTFARVYSSFPNFLGLSPPAVFFAVPDSAGNFLFSVGDPRFSEVQLYYHMDRAHARFQALGYKGLDRPLEGVVWDAHAAVIGPYFSPIYFAGRGGIFFAPMLPSWLDAAWDADLIYHEYTHAIVNSVVGASQGKSFRAVNEGFADYFSSSFMGDSCVAEFAGAVLGSRSPCLRSLENRNQYPRDLFGEEHLDSLIWSGTLWDIRSALGADRADRVVLRTLQTLTSMAELPDAAVAVWAAAQNLYGTQAHDQVGAILENRGIFTWEGLSAFLATDLARSVPVSGQVSAASSSVCILNNLQEYRISVPAGASALTVALSASAPLQVFVRFRRPVAVVDGKVQFEQASDVGVNAGVRVDFSSIPELQSGVYYLAVGNCNTSPVAYSIASDYNAGASSVTPLAPGIASRGSMPAGPFLNSRQFTVQVPQGATSLNVKLEGSTDIDLYVTSGGSVQLSEQGLPAGDAFADSESSSESLTITPLTVPALQPGTYYIGVYNYNADTLATFSVTASVTTNPPESTRIVGLQSGSPVQASVPAGSPGLGSFSSVQYSVQVPAGATKLTVAAVANPKAAAVYIRRNAPIAIQGSRVTFDHLLLLAYASLYEISSATSPSLQSGTYYIAVVNFSPSLAAVTLTATVPGVITNPIPVANTLVPNIVKGGSGPFTLTVNGSAFIQTSVVKWNGNARGTTYLSGTQLRASIPGSDIAAVGNVRITVENPSPGGGASNALTLPITAAGGSFEPSLSRYLAPGFYILEATLASSAASGYWGLEVLTSLGQAAGGFNLGGALPASGVSPGFGAFMLSTTQTVTANVNAQGPTGTTLTMRFLDSKRQQIGSSVTGRAPLTARYSLQSGFYIVEVLSTASVPVTYQLGLSADFFAGGVDTGGFLGSGIVGFGAFYVPEAQNVLMKLFGKNTYGTGGAGDMVLTLKDANRNVIQTVSP